MKRFSGIDYDQRPASYLEDHDALANLLRNVQGTRRRELIRDYWNTGRIGELPGELLREGLSSEVREALGKIHPACMGGEYLPSGGTGDIEIARIELQSTTADVISIRATQRRRAIYYSIVDEYETEFELQRKRSWEPLSLGQMVAFIDGSRQPDYQRGLGLCFNNMNAEGMERSKLRHFSRISSGFYPQLEQHYEQVYEKWVRKA
jgi:hypothetical protein